MVCYECGKQNASMNLVCAYCRFPFAQDRVAILRHENAARARLAGALLVAALGLMLALCSSIFYIIVLTR